jgi:hypothetical protein
MASTPQDVAIIGDDVLNDLGGAAEELKLHRFLGNLKLFMQTYIYKKAKCFQL